MRSFISWQPWLREPSFAEIQLALQLCPFLNQEAQLVATDVLVTSHLDYCNVFCMRLPLGTTQEAAAPTHVIMGAPWCTYVTMLLL